MSIPPAEAPMRDAALERVTQTVDAVYRRESRRVLMQMLVSW